MLLNILFHASFIYELCLGSSFIEGFIIERLTAGSIQEVTYRRRGLWRWRNQERTYCVINVAIGLLPAVNNWIAPHLACT